jgi:protein-tyrosine phosphatase
MPETDDLTRALPIPNLHNVRDLGGLPTRDGQSTRWRSLLRADDLHHLSPAGLQALHDYGVETVLDLRWDEERARFPSGYRPGANGRRLRHVSLLGKDPQDWSARSQNVPWEQWNRAVLDHAQPEMAAALRVAAEAPPGPLLFHCVAGKDRTGLVAALLLALAEVEPDAIAADYALSAVSLRASWLAGQPEDKWPEIIASLSCPPARIHAALAHVDERYGGPAGYARAIGLSEAQTQRLRARLRDDAQTVE